MVPTSRKVALQHGDRHYHGKPCKNCSNILRYSSNGECVECKNARSKKSSPDRSDYFREWRESNRDRANDSARRFRDKHPERVKESRDAWRRNNTQRITEYTRLYYIENRESILAKHRLSNSLNRGYRNNQRAISRINYCAELGDYLDSNKLEIQSIYDEAFLLSKITGIDHHVDHIIPLSSKEPIGVHAPHNLQIVTAKYNKRKASKIDAEEFPEQKQFIASL